MVEMECLLLVVSGIMAPKDVPAPIPGACDVQLTWQRGFAVEIKSRVLRRRACPGSLPGSRVITGSSGGSESTRDYAGGPDLITCVLKSG